MTLKESVYICIHRQIFPAVRHPVFWSTTTAVIGFDVRPIVSSLVFSRVATAGLRSVRDSTAIHTEKTIQKYLYDSFAH